MTDVLADVDPVAVLATGFLLVVGLLGVLARMLVPPAIRSMERVAESNSASAENARDAAEMIRTVIASQKLTLDGQQNIVRTQERITETLLGVANSQQAHEVREHSRHEAMMKTMALHHEQLIRELDRPLVRKEDR